MSGGFGDLGLLPELVAAVEEQWLLPTDIQDECIPLLIGGTDVLGSAATGSGKTAAFGLPILQLAVEHKLRAAAKGETDNNSNEKQKQEKTRASGGKGNTDTPPIEIHMSTQDRDSAISIHPENACRIQTTAEKEWVGCRSTVGVRLTTSSKYVWEVKLLYVEGIVRLGWSTGTASLCLGSDAFGFGYGGTGKKVTSSKYSDYPDGSTTTDSKTGPSQKVSFGKGDVIAACLETTIADDKDSDAEESGIRICFAKNGQIMEEAFSLPKSSTKPEMTALFPTICMKNCECEAAFSDLNFTYDGFVPIGKMAPQHRAWNPTNMPLAVSPESLTGCGPFAIVIEPTRDLAQQTFNFFQDMISKASLPLQAVCLVGGKKVTNMLKKLSQGEVDILVGTAPIVATHVKKGTIPTNNCLFFCLDEADELVNTDHMEHVQSIYARLVARPPGESVTERLQVCFFSATLRDPNVQKIANAVCHRPMWVDLRGDQSSTTPNTITHLIVRVVPRKSQMDDRLTTDAVHRKGNLNDATDFKGLSQKELKSEQIKLTKPQILVDLIGRLKMDHVLVFCRTNLDCNLLEQFFRKIGDNSPVSKYSCRVLAGKRTMADRAKALKDFKAGEVRILIATDVAARGIDIPELPFVVNMTLPDKCPETYVHRTGRVGRAKRRGMAISIVATVEERVWYCQSGNNPPCSDTKDYSDGGNCIWYSEPNLFANVRNHLSSNATKLHSVDWPIQEKNISKQTMQALRNESYGDRKDKKKSATNLKFKRVHQTACDIDKAEEELQKRFLLLKTKVFTP